MGINLETNLVPVSQPMSSLVIVPLQHGGRDLLFKEDNFIIGGYTAATNQ